MPRTVVIVMLAITVIISGCTDSSGQSKHALPNLPDGAVWVQYFANFDAYLPISRVTDGTQQLLNDEPEWYFQLQERLGLNYSQPQDALVLDIRSMYSDSETNPYDNPLADGDWLPLPMGDKLVLSGNWDPFVVQARYECYTLQTQPDNPAWSRYFKTKITEVAAGTPLLIKDAWFFDIDGDGQEESFVNASNTLKAQGLQNRPAADSTAIYSLAAYFGSDGSAMDMGEYVSTSLQEVSSEPLNPEKEIYSSYIVDGNRLEYSEQSVAAYQYDADGQLTLCPIFSSGEYYRTPEKNIIIADIDGDGKAELLTRFPSEYARMTIFHFDEHWRPQVQFSIWTPS